MLFIHLEFGVLKKAIDSLRKQQKVSDTKSNISSVMVSFPFLGSGRSVAAWLIFRITRIIERYALSVYKLEVISDEFPTVFSLVYPQQMHRKRIHGSLLFINDGTLLDNS